MLNDAEKEELRRIVNKFIAQGRCARPVHPETVMLDVKRFKQTEDCAKEGGIDRSRTAVSTVTDISLVEGVEMRLSAPNKPFNSQLLPTNSAGQAAAVVAGGVPPPMELGILAT
jgi:hypothetical protein